MDKDIKIDTPVAKDMINRDEKITKPKKEQEIQTKSWCKLKGTMLVNRLRATTHTSCNRELFTSLDEVSFKIKVANQKFVQVVGKGDVHIPGLGRIKEVLFIPEIPYNVLAIIKLIKGTKIEVLFNNGTIQLTNDGKEVGDVIVTSGLAYFIPTMNTTTKWEGRRRKDDNADSDTSDEEIEGK
ncbi:hypothetical protein E2320_014450, partial [Naja naja]